VFQIVLGGAIVLGGRRDTDRRGVSMIPTRRAALAQSGTRFSEKIMLKQKSGR